MGRGVVVKSERGGPEYHSRLPRRLLPWLKPLQHSFGGVGRLVLAGSGSGGDWPVRLALPSAVGPVCTAWNHLVVRPEPAAFETARIAVSEAALMQNLVPPPLACERHARTAKQRGYWPNLIRSLCHLIRFKL